MIGTKLLHLRNVNEADKFAVYNESTICDIVTVLN